MSEEAVVTQSVALSSGTSMVTKSERNKGKTVGWMRDKRGEWQFDDDPAGLAIMVLPTWIVWSILSSATAAALPLPVEGEGRIMLTLIVLGVPLASGVPALSFLGYRYQDEQVALAAEMLAREGLLRGRGGRRRRKALHRMDKMAVKIARASAELDKARRMLEKTGEVEPLLLEEIDDRSAVLRNDLKTQRRQAEAYARQEKINAIGTDEEIAEVQRQKEATSALNHAMQALEKSRNTIYR